MPALEDNLNIETDLFEHREVKPHFINDCCFGEDFAAWLRSQVIFLESEGFSIDESIQEDYGWGFFVRRGKESLWIALSFAGDGPTEEPAEWVVGVTYDSGLSLVKRLFHTPDPAVFCSVRDRVFAILKNTDGIRILDR